LRGLFRGALTHRNFALLFDWFYPEYFGIIKKSLDVFKEKPWDDEVLLVIMKCIHDLLDNSSNRLRFDTWSINGLIVYKESASLMNGLMEYFDCLSPKQKPPLHKDIDREVFKFLRLLLGMLEHCIQGNYINFAICEYYNDFTFTQLSKNIMRCLLN